MTDRALESIVFSDAFAVGLTTVSLALALFLGTGYGGLDFCFDDGVVAGRP